MHSKHQQKSLFVLCNCENNPGTVVLIKGHNDML